MIDDPNTPVPDDAEPANPFAGLQAELDEIGLDELGKPKQDPVELPPQAQPQPGDVGGPAASAPVSSVATAAAGASPKPSKLRLCPGCNEVREFVDDRCLNCGYQLDSATPHGADAAYLVGQAYDSPRSPWTKVGLVILVLALLGVAGWFAYPTLVGKERRATDANTDVAGAAAKAEAEQEVVALQTITIDDALKARIASAIREGNEAWGDAGTKAYVYRFSIREQVEPAKLQMLGIHGYVGGEAAANAVANADQTFLARMQGLLDDLNSTPGVQATFQLLVDEEGYQPGHEYVIYGKDFGRDHMDEIKPVIDAIENYKHANGQYPLALDKTVGNFRTKGNPQFIPSGFGYIPLFKTDGAGNIAMGSGSGIKKLMPAEVSGYYLLRFLSKATEGLDFYRESDLTYYTQKISPFPYQPSGKVRNMPLTPDGKPDGVGAIVKNGELQ